MSSDLAQQTNQGRHTFLHFCADPKEETLTTSVVYFEGALAACPPGHHCRPAALCNLARAYFIRCQTYDGATGLPILISYYQEALELRRVGHPDRPATLLHLAQVLLYRFGKLGAEESPSQITKLALEVSASCPMDSHEHRAAGLILQTYALYKAINSRSLVDIDKLIPKLRKAIQDVTYDYFDIPQRLSNLSLALWMRYKSHGDVDELNESILTCGLISTCLSATPWIIFCQISCNDVSTTLQRLTPPPFHF